MKPVVVITHQVSPRLQYICKVIFTDYFEIPFRISTETEHLDSDVIYYGNQFSEFDGLHIPDNGLLFESDIKDQTLPVTWQDELPYFFGSVVTGDLQQWPFDLFALCFYTLSRYEEYIEGEKDRYGRFPGNQSIAAQHNFERIPIVDLWIKRFGTFMSDVFGRDVRLSGQFKSRITVDIDLPYAYRYKGWKSVGGYGRDLIQGSWDNLSSRTNYFLRGHDPFDTYAEIREVCQEVNQRPIFFLLNSNKGKLDENHIAGRLEWTKLISELSEWADIGIHPSTYANDESSKILEEKSLVEEVLHREVVDSRHHFIKIHFPKSYRALIACGIRKDYSMIMDATMRYYLKCDPDESLDIAKKLVEQTREVNGSFHFIWHNSSLSQAYGWGPWKKVFLELCKM